jgi:hypothetical protein
MVAPSSCRRTRDVGGVPGVVRDLPDLEQGGIGEGSLRDGTVVDDVARGRLNEALPGPEVVGHAVARSAACRDSSGTK